MKNKIICIFALLLAVSLIFCGCAETSEPHKPQVNNQSNAEGYITSVKDVPAFNGEPFVVINDNVPDFSDKDMTDKSYEKYSPLDYLGRCGVAMACIGRDIMPTEDRGSIGQVKPSGWKTVKYDYVDGKYLYNRCHLIGFQLTGENANERNLITGTRYMNVDGMLPFENMLADYVKETDNHVIYRVTPIFDGNNLVARGVQLEAKSVEDKGEGICFNVYVYNNQPQISINYENGESKYLPQESNTENSETEYILNTNSKKFHRKDCGLSKDIKEHNKATSDKSRDELINSGYSPCKNCNP